MIRSDGSPERDYLYVEDAVEAYLTVAESLRRPELYGRAWNAGCGEAVSVIDVTRRLIAVSGLDIEPDIQGEGTPHGEIDRQYLDSSRHARGARLAGVLGPGPRSPGGVGVVPARRLAWTGHVARGGSRLIGAVSWRAK